jgi:fructokinase
MKNSPITIFGEVLFDHFPDGISVLGGAPFNVAWHLQAFGQQPQFISRVGDDATGKLIRSAMQSWGISLDYLQLDSDYPTGQVQVTLIQGEPAYAILPDQAYDHIQMHDLEDNADLGILYHGTLAARSAISRQTLASLKALRPGKIFIDVNLRQPWWHKSDVLSLIKDADWVKLNNHELQALQETGTDLRSTMENFLALYNLEGLIVTLGEAGAYGLNNKGDFISASPTTTIDVIDTVGAGDAFSAVVLLGLNLGWPLSDTMTKAQQFASAIVKQRGATIVDRGFYEPFTQAWQLN